MVNADLDESIYDSMLYQHIVDGGIEELFISYDALRRALHRHTNTRASEYS